MVAAMMRLRPQRTIDVDDLNCALCYTHEANALETTNKRVLKVTGTREYYGGCADAKVMRGNAAKMTTRTATRLMERVFDDTTGPFDRLLGQVTYTWDLVDVREEGDRGKYAERDHTQGYATGGERFRRSYGAV